MSASTLDRVHHISFVVRDLDRGVAQLRRLLDVPEPERGPVPGRGAEVAVFRLRNLNIELVAPVTPDSGLWRRLEAHGEGFFHLAFGVDDVDAACRDLARRGLRMQGRPYVAFRDWRIAYIDPEDAGWLSLHVIDADAD
ncbi:MAG TPA: VOC family protein [Gammaproteobacteria bacterium]|nr:VOC family protein [Gammaproteobacteria bacterium]